MPGGPLGKVILIGDVFARVVGVAAPQQGGFGSSQNLSVYLPFTSVQTRFVGSNSLRSITVKVADGTDECAATYLQVAKAIEADLEDLVNQTNSAR